MKNKSKSNGELSDEEIQEFLQMIIRKYASCQKHSLTDEHHDEFVKNKIDTKLKKLIQEKLGHNKFIIYYSEKECDESEEEKDESKKVEQPLLIMILVLNQKTGKILVS